MQFKNIKDIIRKQRKPTLLTRKNLPLACQWYEQCLCQCLVQCRKHCPQGKVRVQMLCHLNDSMLLQGRVVPTTDQGVTYEPF